MFKLAKLLTLGVCCIALLNMGTIRKQQSAILDTQTGPIKYEDKMEEIKDGVKGAPAPTIQLYPKYAFLIDPPYVEGEDPELTAEELGIPMLGEPIPEDVEGGEEAPETFDWWQVKEPLEQKKV